MPILEFNNKILSKFKTNVFLPTSYRMRGLASALIRFVALYFKDFEETLYGFCFSILSSHLFLLSLGSASLASFCWRLLSGQIS